MALIGVLQTMVDGQIITAAQHNSNYADIKTAFNTSAVLTDVAKVITVTHVWSATQTFSGGVSLGAPITSDLLFTDALYDIGKTGATRPRDGFFSRNVLVGGTFQVNGAATFVTLTRVAGALSSELCGAFYGAGAPPAAGLGLGIEIKTGAIFAYDRNAGTYGPINYTATAHGFGGGPVTLTGGHLLFTDATYDIGAAGATRPRDFFLYRNIVAGGSIAGGGLISTNSGGFDSTGANNYYRVAGTVVVGPRATGYTNGWTGAAANRATAYDAASITLPQLAARVRALQDDLQASTGHGLIGA